MQGVIPLRNRMIAAALLLAVCLGLMACGAEPEASSDPTTPPTAAPTEPETTVPPTEAPPELPEVVMPTKDAATGTLQFYFGDKAVYAGCPVADLLELDVQTDADLDAVLEPRHMSALIRLRIEDGTPDSSQQFNLFIVAWNPSETPTPIRDAIVYSISVNTDSGIRFGSGQETTPFVTGETTLEEILGAYGVPGYDCSRQRLYQEIAYFEPFSCAYFSFKQGKVRQVSTYYSANYLGSLAEELDTAAFSTYFGMDAYILMDQYLDIGPYLVSEDPDAAENQQAEAAGEDAQDQTQPVTPPLASLSTAITLDGKEFQLGIRCDELPEPFRSALIDLIIPLGRNYYYRVGRINPEEFNLLNDGRDTSDSNGLLVKGVFTQNRNYTSWGKDYSAFHTFSYMGLTNDSSIEDILEQFGAPMELLSTSSAKACNVWMHYSDEAGNTLRILVDPLLDQIVEFRLDKYYEKAKMYT